MAFIFPNSPTLGQIANGYTWDGEKWTIPVLVPGPSNANPIVNGVAAPGTANAYSRGDHVHPSDPSKLDASDATLLKTTARQTTTAGFRFTAYNAGTFTAGQTFTPDAYNGNYQYYTNNGAHTLATPSPDCAMDIMVINGASAGAITFSGFAGGTTGDALTTTNGHRFIISIRRIASFSAYLVKALQ